MYTFYRIKQIREQMEYTQKEISEELQIQQVVYSRYETGKREIPLHLMIQLSLLYKVSMDYICGLTDKKERY